MAEQTGKLARRRSESKHSVRRFHRAELTRPFETGAAESAALILSSRFLSSSNVTTATSDLPRASSDGEKSHGGGGVVQYNLARSPERKTAHWVLDAPRFNLLPQSAQRL